MDKSYLKLFDKGLKIGFGGAGENDKNSVYGVRAF